MSQTGKFRIITQPDDIFVGTAVGDLAVVSSQGIFLGAVPVGLTAPPHIKLDEDGVVIYEHLTALDGLEGDISTGLINPQISAAGIQINSGTGTIRLDSVVVDNNDVQCDTLTSTTSINTATATLGTSLVLPKSILNCPTGLTALRMDATSPVFDVALTGDLPGSLRVAHLLAKDVATENASTPFNVKGNLLVDGYADIGTTLRVRGATTFDGAISFPSLTIGDGASAPVFVQAPYLNIDTLTQVPSLRLGSGVVVAPSTWGSRNAAQYTYGGLPAFVEVDGVVLVGPVRTTNPIAVRHINGIASTVYVDSGALSRFAPIAAASTMVVDPTGLLSATTAMNVRNDLECTNQIAAPSYRVLGGATANEVVLTGTATGLRSDKNVIAPSFTIEGSADITPIAGGGSYFSTKISAPQVLIRNATTATTVSTLQTDFDGASRVIAPYLRLAGDIEVQLQPTSGGTRIQPGILDLSYNTALATIGHLRVAATETGLSLHTPRLYFEGGTTSLISSFATGTLRTSNMATLDLDGVVQLEATTQTTKTQLSIVADVLKYGKPATNVTQTPEAGGVLMGPSADFTMRAATRIALQAPSSVGMVMQRPDTTWSKFEFTAGSKGELRVNNRDIGLTPYDAFANAVSFTAPDVDGWYTYLDSTNAAVFRARRYDLGRPALLRSPAENFVIPGFVDSLYSGVAETIYVNPLGGTSTFKGAWVDVQFPKSLSLKRLQTVLLSANQADRRPAVWRLYARSGAPGIGQIATNWVELLRGGVAEMTDPADKELQVYDTFRLAVSIVTSGDEVRLTALNLWGVDAAPTVTPQNSFTGQHYVVPAPGVAMDTLRPGMVVIAAKGHDSVGEGGFKARGGQSAITSDAALPMVALSDQAADKRVFGVVDSIKRNVWVPYNDFRLVVNSLGEGAILVANTNGAIENGDLLQTSRVPGYAERQDSDVVTSKTIAKATMDCDFKPAKVPVMRIVMTEKGVPALDDNEFVMWEPTGEDEPEYEMTRMFAKGCVVARISCTYKCG
jgi:hypothetical protein